MANKRVIREWFRKD